MEIEDGPSSTSRFTSPPDSVRLRVTEALIVVCESTCATDILGFAQLASLAARAAEFPPRIAFGSSPTSRVAARRKTVSRKLHSAAER